MFGLYPKRYSSPYHYYDNDYNDYVRALAAQQAREREEARYRAQLEEARRRRAYQEQLARAQEAERRRRSYNSYLSGFEPYYDDEEYEPYPSFARPSNNLYDRPASYAYAEPEEEYQYPQRRGRQQILEDMIRQKMAEKERASMQTPRTASRSPKRKESPLPETYEPPRQVGYRSLQSKTTSSYSPKQRQKTPPVQRAPPSPRRSASPSRQTPSPKPQVDPKRVEAARRIQAFFRTQLPRYKALKAIYAISKEFDNAISTFVFPSSLDFAESTSSLESPEMLYTPRNAPLRAHEEALIKLLSKLDAVESFGDQRIRAERKKLVKRIEKHLVGLGEKKVELWHRMNKEEEGDRMETTPERDDVEMENASEVKEEEMPTLVQAPESVLIAELSAPAHVEEPMNISTSKVNEHNVSESIQLALEAQSTSTQHGNEPASLMPLDMDTQLTESQPQCQSYSRPIQGGDEPLPIVSKNCNPPSSSVPPNVEMEVPFQPVVSLPCDDLNASASECNLSPASEEGLKFPVPDEDERERELEQERQEAAAVEKVLSPGLEESQDFDGEKILFSVLGSAPSSANVVDELCV